MRMSRLLALALTFALAPACTELLGSGEVNGEAVVAPAQGLLGSGSVPAAIETYDQLYEAHPELVEVAVGKAYAEMVRGNYAEADRVLEQIQQTLPPEEQGEVLLRRALIALRQGQDKFDQVKEFGKASGLPVGKLLAAEVHMADAEANEAIDLFNEVEDEPGIVGETAQAYLELADSGSPVLASLAEVNALWALGSRGLACDSAQDLVKSLPDDRPDKSDLLLLWAGRSVTSGRPDVAADLLDAISFPPEGQAWRIRATEGMIQVVRGEKEQALETFAALAQGGTGIPADGVADALATAASLTDDPDLAQQLAGGVESEAAARGLLAAGAEGAAKTIAPPGTLRNYLENR